MERCEYYKYNCCYAQKGSPTAPCRGDKTECTNNTSRLNYEDVAVMMYKKSLIYALKQYTSDYVKIYVSNDTFIIEFYFVGELSYSTTVKDIYTKIKDGTPTLSIAEKIIKTYKVALLARHFK